VLIALMAMSVSTNRIKRAITREIPF